MFINTLKLTQFMLQREKVNSTVWLVSMVFFNALIVLLIGFSMMPNEASVTEFMAILENPTLLAMVGPMHPSLPSDLGALYTLMMFVFMAIGVAIMNIFLVVRHTRADEEAGRYEVLRSLPSGRLANVNAAMLTAVVVNLVMAVGFTLSMWLVMAIIDVPMGFGAALLWGVCLGVLGLVFASVAALFCQLSASASGASGYSYGLLGLFYFLRAGADMDPEGMGYLAYFSPFGLASRTWVYIENNWWPVCVLLGIAIVITVLAYGFCNVRDIDQGMIPDRRGKVKGGILLRSPIGLHFRLLRRSVIIWVIILFMTGLSYATLLEDINNFIAGNDMYRQLMLGHTGLMDQIDGMTTDEIAAVMNAVLSHAGYNITQLFASMIGFIMAMIAAIPVLMFVLKAKGEEKAIRAELLVATPTSKGKYLSGFVIISFASCVLIQLAQALGMYSLAQSVLTDPSVLPLSYLVEAALVYVPSLWIMGGLTVLLLGIFPKAAGFIWAYYGYTFFAMMFGRFFPQIEFLGIFTPLGWTPQMPVDDANWFALTVMAALGIALSAIGIMCYKKRDINAITH